VAVVALALVLFLDAVNLELTELRGDWLVIGLLAGSGMLLLELPVILALLLGTILASTDPVVLRDVLRDLRIPRSVRRTLSVEAGTNDLVVLPILLVLIAVAHADPGGVGDWLGFVAQLFVLGPAAGFAVGAVGSWVMDRVDRHFQIRREYQSLSSTSRCTVSAWSSGPLLPARPSVGTGSWPPSPPDSPSPSSTSRCAIASSCCSARCCPP
jgi:sodium/hydrogen antiporter